MAASGGDAYGDTGQAGHHSQRPSKAIVGPADPAGVLDRTVNDLLVVAY